MDENSLSLTDRVPAAFLAGGGEMGRRVRDFDWSATPLGPAEGWPRSLKIAVRIMLDSRYAMWLGWGPEFTFFYNDDYARMTLGPKHPWALGRSAREVWSEIWGDIGPRADSVVRTGQATWDEGLLLFLERRGFPEETYHTFSYSPLPDDHGGVGGMLCVVTEDTERTIGERRLRTLRELAARTTDVSQSAEEACQAAARILAANAFDLPFALLYLLDGDGRQARLSGEAGLDRGSPASPAFIDLQSPRTAWPLRRVVETGEAVEVEDLPARFGPLPGGAWPESPRSAVVLPMARPGQSRLAGFVVVGISPRRPLDDHYRGFLDLLAGQLASAVANAHAYEEERRRAEALAELDRAKTAFFSNVSHEFRTPLTLLLGPVQDLLDRGDDALSAPAKAQLAVVNRNGLRLLRLVNSLLDFSRIEAGRVRAEFRPTDLAAFTADLASVFRAAIEKAGLRLVIDCETLDEPVYVDREMWEKIVLNLLSNAFKFTFEGEIAIALTRFGDTVQLRVRDTGTGIPRAELPRLFERFHRIENASGRTHEGSGIGLALVQELVKLHDGRITAESVEGKGTTFTVVLPLGCAHLPKEQIAEGGRFASSASGAIPFVEEALRWLPDEGPPESDPSPVLPEYHDPRTSRDLEPERVETTDQPRIFVVDDNADMRRYVVRLLSGRYRVEALPDGEAALLAARDRPPDLILTDVMMPRLDGFGLLRALRSDALTRNVPVIMLSARAGEESRIEGMKAGADDYLVKPFASRELLARVSAHLQMALMRREANESIRKSEERLRMALVAARMVAWQWKPGDGSLLVSDNASDLFGLPEGIGLSWINQGISLLHPEDVEGYRATFTRAIQERGTYLTHYRLVRPVDGTTLWMEERGHAVCGDSGEVEQLVGVVMDITDRRAAETNSRRNEERLRLFVEHAPAAVAMLDRDLRYLLVSRRWLSDFEIGDVDLKGQHHYDVMPETPPAWKEVHARCLAGAEERADEDLYVRNDGREEWLRWETLPWRDDRGEVGGILIFSEIITEQVRNRRVVQEHNAFMHAVLSQVPAAIVVSDAGTGKILLSNQEAHRIVQHEYEPGRTLDDYGTTFLKEALRPDGSRYGSQDWPLVRAQRGETVAREEMELVLCDGSRKTIRVNAGPICVGDEVVAAVVAYHDISDRKASEQAARFLADASGILAGLVDYEATLQRVARLAVPTFADWAVVDMAAADGSIKRLAVAHADPSKADLAFEVHRRYPPDPSLPYGASVVLRTGRSRFIHEVTDEALVAAATSEDHLRLLRELGLKSYLCVPLLVRGETLGVLGFASAESGRRYDEHDLAIAEDLASRAAIAIENARLYAELKQADRRKNEFLATLAHELRNPLAPIRNALHLMRETATESEGNEADRAMAERQVVHLTRLIDDLMDVARISRGKIELHKEVVDLATIVNQAIETSRPQIVQRNHHLTVSLPDQVIRLEADPTRLEQVLWNLLNNAAKYSDPGARIHLTVEPRGLEVLIRLKDSGIGIKPDMLARIFEMFTQVDEHRNHAGGGLGIGLSLVRSLVEMHGGTISAHSDGPGLGSEFVVKLPILAPKPAAIERPGGSEARKDPGQARRRILVVDDNTDAGKTLARLLTRLYGHDTRVSHDGPSALDAAEEFQPEVLLLDIGMPGMDGYEVARTIRGRPRGESIVIIALTGWGQEDDRRRSEEAGFNHHLVKPVDPKLLAQLLAELPSGEPVRGQASR